MTITDITTTRSAVDAHGNPVSGPAAAIPTYDDAVDRLARLQPESVALASVLAEVHDDFPMGHAFGAYLALVATDAAELPAARTSAAALHRSADNEREMAHAAAIDAWLAGDWHGAARILDALLVRWPSDLLALVIGHQLDFFVGDAQNLRDRPARALPAFDPAHPHHGLVCGMFAFGLEESGHYERAEAVGYEAVGANPDDVWAIHAVTHTYEMRGQVDDGIRFLRSREANWGDENFLAVHNWWHLALYLLEAGLPDEALAIYDRRVHHEDSERVLLEMVDASALLWRLFLDGVPTGGRFSVLADAWAATADEPWYAFNDLHAAMALAGAGRLDEARTLIAVLSRYVEDTTGSHASNRAMTAEVGLPACRAVLATAEGRPRDVLADLLPIRGYVQRFGGSHAQRDAVARTLLEAAIACGEHDLARALVSERLSLRDTSVYARLRQARLAEAAGDAAGAAAAQQRAAADQRRFAGAVAP